MKHIVFFLILNFSLFTCFLQSQTELPFYPDSLMQLETFLSDNLPGSAPGAAVMISYKDQVVFEKYYGLAKIDCQERLGKNHLMGIASMSKQFTGMAVLLLQEQGKLNLDDDIRMYFPDLPLADRKISIRQLLSHTSGLPELTRNEKFMGEISAPHHVNEIISTAFIDTFRSEPGEKFIYCNTGYTIAVALVEKLSRMDFATFLKLNFFDKLQMNHTYCCDIKQDNPDSVYRYEKDSTGWKKSEKIHFSNLIGGGSIVSNARDITKWNMALLSGENLPANYRLILKPILLNSGESTEYGLGLGMSEVNGNIFYYHPGMGSGMNSINLIFPEKQVSITVIRNISKPVISSNIIALEVAKCIR